jgi:hypothetical protein
MNSLLESLNRFIMLERMAKNFQIIISIAILSFAFACKSAVISDQDSLTSQNTIPEPTEQELLPAPVEGEIMLDENGDEVNNSILQPVFFQQASKDNLEYFRVILSANQYLVRQIRGSKYIRRIPDSGADDLTRDEIHGYDLVNLVDEGNLYITLNSNTGNMEVINFDRRVPRINDVAKIIQNDLTRWQFKHESSEDKPIITRFKVFYQIHLSKTLTRQEIKEKYFKKK